MCDRSSRRRWSSGSNRVGCEMVRSDVGHRGLPAVHPSPRAHTVGVRRASGQGLSEAHGTWPWAGRQRGKSDPIDALAVARVALREPDLPRAHLDGQEREVRLLLEYREGLVEERTRTQNRLRSHLYELDPGAEPPARSLGRQRTIDRVRDHLRGIDGTVARLARELLERLDELNHSIDALEAEITALVEPMAPTLLSIPGCGALTAAKIVAETADIRRFRSSAAYAMHNGTAPIPIWSGNTPRHRLNRGGNRQLNCALHRIAVTQLRWDGRGRDYFERPPRQRQHQEGSTPRPTPAPLRHHLPATPCRHHCVSSTTRDRRMT